MMTIQQALDLMETQDLGPGLELEIWAEIGRKLIATQFRLPDDWKEMILDLEGLVL